MPYLILFIQQSMLAMFCFACNSSPAGIGNTNIRKPLQNPVIIESRFWGDSSKKVTASIQFDNNGNATISRTISNNSNGIGYYHAVYGGILATQMADHPDTIQFWLNHKPTNYEYYWVPLDPAGSAGIVNITTGGNQQGPPDGLIICDCAMGLQGGDCDVSAMLSGNLLNVTCTVKERCSRCKAPRLVRSGGLTVSDKPGILLLAKSVQLTE